MLSKIPVIYIYKIKSANIPKSTDTLRYTEALQEVQAGHILRNSFRAVILLIKTQTCGVPHSDIRKKKLNPYLLPNDNFPWIFRPQVFLTV